MLTKKVDLPATMEYQQKVGFLRNISSEEAQSSDRSEESDQSQSNNRNTPSISCIYQTSSPEPSIETPSSAGSTGEESEEDEGNLTIDRQLPLTIIFIGGEKVEYSFEKSLAKGSYGEVFLLTKKASDTEEIPERICLKVGRKKGDVDGDALVLKRLKGSSCQGTLIDSFVLELEFRDLKGQIWKEPLIIMEHMKGNLKSFFQSYQFDRLLDKYVVTLFILSKITTSFYHLLNKGFYYTDVKISNCLFRLEPSLRVVLADIGSAVPKDSQDAIATYPHPYHHKCHHFSPHIYDLIYGLLILFFEMMSFSPKSQPELSFSRDLLDNLYFREIKRYKTNEKIKLLSNIFDEIRELNQQDPLKTKLNEILSSVKERTVYDLKAIKEKDPASQLHSLYLFFKQNYQSLIKHSKIGNKLGIE
jgi:hypothetical protein